MDDTAADHVHDAVLTASTTSLDPLCQVMRASGGTVVRAWEYLGPKLNDRLAEPDGVDVFNELLDAILEGPSPSSVLFSALVTGLNSKEPPIIEGIHARRAQVMPLLGTQARVGIALYEIEIGSRDNWPDWLEYLADPPIKPSRTNSEWARDAA
jgi:hypothetical protein